MDTQALPDGNSVGIEQQEASAKDIRFASFARYDLCWMSHIMRFFAILFRLAQHFQTFSGHALFDRDDLRADAVG
jgi:hypothetical protein